MGRIQEYRKKCKELSEKIRIAQIRFDEIGKNAISYQDVYDLGGENKLENCINKFNRVRLPNGQINDEGGTTVYCEHLFGDHVFCDIWKCDCMKQFGRFCYIKTKQELDDAIAERQAFVVAARRDFFRNMFKSKKRSK